MTIIWIITWITRADLGVGPRSPAPSFLREFFFPVNVYRMVVELCLNRSPEKYRCSKPTFLVANDQSYQNAYSKYPSQTNWIWQFFRETMLPPLPGGCALDAVASALASIIKCQSLLWPQPPVVYWIFWHYMFNMKSRHLLNSSAQNALDCISENFNLSVLRLALSRPYCTLYTTSL